MQVSALTPFQDWETLKALSLPFSFSIDQDFLSSQETCCKAILKACQLEKWELIQKHAEVIAKVRDAFGRTILMQAVNHFPSVSGLIKYKIAIHAKDGNRNRASHHAVMNGAIDSLPLLLDHSTIQAKNALGETVLHLAIKNGQVDIVKQLLAKWGNLNTPILFEGLSFTPLLFAVMRGERNCVSLLLNQETIQQEVEKMGHLLHVAAYFHQSEMIEFLLSYRFEELHIAKLIHQKNGQGQTPLSLAAAQGDLVSVEILSQKGASLETEDHQKRRPIHYAARAKEHAMVQLLAALGCKLTVPDADGHFPIYFVENDSSSDGKSMKHLLNNLMQQKEESRIYMPLPENISFKGEGSAYLEVIQTLEEKKIPLKRLTGHGTSALFATLVALGFKGEEMKQALLERENQFDPHSQNLQELAAIYQLLLSEKCLESPLVNQTGFCLGEKLRDWIESLLCKKTKIRFLTFGELNTLVQKDPTYKHLLLFAEEAKSKAMQRFDSEDLKCANIIISDVLRIALGTPFLFAPHSIHVKKGGERMQKEEERYIQLPSKRFPSVEAYDFQRYQSGGFDFPCYHKKTIGFEMISPSQKENPKNLEELMNALVTVYESQERFLSAYQKPRIIAIEKNESASLATERFFQTRLSQFSRYETLPILIKSLTGRIQLPPSLPPSDFAGREDFLKKLQTLSFPENWSCALQTPLLLLQGPAGIGKTELALTFGNRHIQAFSLIKFIPCENQLLYEQHYKELAEVLKMPTEKKTPEDIILHVHSKLEKMDAEEKPWLLIFDNLEKEIPFPKRGGVVLVTSQRNDLFRSFRPHLLPLTPLKKEEAQTLFTHLSEGEVAQLTEALEGYPILLTLAQRHMQDAHFTVKEYLEELCQKKEHHPLWLPEERYGKSVAAAFQLTLERLEKKHREAFELLQIIAYLNPDHLPLFLFDKALQNKSRLEFLSPLEKAALLYFDEKTRSYSCHRLLQLVIQQLHIQRNEEQDYFEAAMTIVLLEMAEFDYNKLDSWKCGKQGVEQLIYLRGQKYWKEAKTEEEIIKRAILLTRGGEYLCKIQGNFKEALHFHEEVLSFCEKSNLEESGMFKWRSFHYIGIVLWYQGRYDEALEKHQQALAIFKKVLGDEHLDVATSLNNIGNILYSQGRYDEALEEHQQALAIWIKVLGDEHPDVATSLNSIGNVLYSQGRYDEALEKHQQALVIWRKVLGDEHPDVAASLNNIGVALRNQGRYDEALEKHQQALAIRRKVLGDEHPDVATSLNNIGSVLYSQGHYDEALEKHQQALAIWIKVLGDEHPNVAISLNNIELALYSQGRHDGTLEKHLDHCQLL